MTMTAEAPNVVVTPQGAPSIRVAAGAAAAGAAAGWMMAALFTGWAPRVIAVAGALFGAAVVAASTRLSKPSLAQYALAPLAAAIGALLVLPDARGGADLSSLVGGALRGGGLAQPPLLFEPGWRFVLFVLPALITASAASLALALDRPRFVAAIPAPLVLGAALLAPPGSEALNAGVAIALLLSALGIATGAELSRDAGGSGGFERKRLMRAGAMLLALAVAIVGLSQARFLFPATTKERIVPAQRPNPQDPLPDRVLFQVKSDSPGPWRLGVLDAYDGAAWLLPSFDPSRLRLAGANGTLATDPVRIDPDLGTREETFTLTELEGRSLPGSPGAVGIAGASSPIELDPETGTLRLAEVSARPGVQYTVRSVVTPTGRQLTSAPEPPEWAQAYLSVPEAPSEVVTLLSEAPRGSWDRLQFMRAAFYRKVVAAGAGHAAEVPVERVAEMLRGGEGTPYEITAAEALIARWSGVPSRIGYGFYGGQRANQNAPALVRPKHGATWLEVYFDGLGWVPVVGVPPRARSSLSSDPQNANPNVRATDELALVVHVPIRSQTQRLLYESVRYWLGVALLWALGLGLAWWVWPGLLKMVRRRTRRRWAGVGIRERIAVAYADLRDAATDLGVEPGEQSPVAFLDSLAPDDEHQELAWLVTRTLWGDLTRDLREEDVTQAVELAQSVRVRLGRAHPALTRVAAFGSRASLRAPYSDEVPTIAKEYFARRPIRDAIARRRKARKRRRLARSALGAGLLMLIASCGGQAALPTGPNELPDPLLPSIEGIRFKREPSAEKAYATAGSASLVRVGRVYTIREGRTVQGSLQVSAFDDDVNTLDSDVRDAIVDSLGSGRFRIRRLGAHRVWGRDLPEQRLLLWFTPDGGSAVLLDVRRGFADADATFQRVVDTVLGIRTSSAGPASIPYDSRRGANP